MYLSMNGGCGDVFSFLFDEQYFLQLFFNDIQAVSHSFHDIHLTFLQKTTGHKNCNFEAFKSLEIFGNYDKLSNRQDRPMQIGQNYIKTPLTNSLHLWIYDVGLPQTFKDSIMN